MALPKAIAFSIKVRYLSLPPNHGDFHCAASHIVKDTSEATLDSRYLILASDMGAAKAKAMKNDGSGFDVDDFLSKLVTYMGGRKGGINRHREGSEELEQEEEEEEDDDDDDSPLDWEKTGQLALAKSHRVPAMDFMRVDYASNSCVFANVLVRLGPLSTEQKQRKKAQRTKFEKNKEQERAPQEVTCEYF